MSAIESGATVTSSPYCATPNTLLRGLGRRASEVGNIVLQAGVLLGDASYHASVLAGDLTLRTWQLSTISRRLVGVKGFEYVPTRAHDIWRNRLLRGDVAIARVTPPDREGNCSLGPSASYTKPMLEQARVRIAEIDPSMPRTCGIDVTYPLADFDFVVDSDEPMSHYLTDPGSAATTAIGYLVASLIPHGAVLQLGIGAVPEAVARALAGTKIGDLRLVGLLSDAMINMMESGQVPSVPDAVQAVELLGSERVFQFAHENRTVLMRSSKSVHDPSWLSTRGTFVSVCSALEVDLTGQVASEAIEGRPIAGVGGSADFFEGAHLSTSGIRIVALPSVTRGGTSRIKAGFSPGTPVTIPRHSVDYVVTEHGIARLTGRSERERCQALLAIADPAHRETIQSTAESFGTSMPIKEN